MSVEWRGSRKERVKETEMGSSMLGFEIDFWD
jgi:hypothetical protein